MNWDMLGAMGEFSLRVGRTSSSTREQSGAGSEALNVIGNAETVSGATLGEYWQMLAQGRPVVHVCFALLTDEVNPESASGSSHELGHVGGDGRVARSHRGRRLAGLSGSTDSRPGSRQAKAARWDSIVNELAHFGGSRRSRLGRCVRSSNHLRLHGISRSARVLGRSETLVQ